jgi:hypothetical protein
MNLRQVWRATDILLVILFAASGPTYAETEQTRAERERVIADMLRASTAFECSVIADLANLEDEAVRLFEYGYARGERAAKGLAHLPTEKLSKEQADALSIPRYLMEKWRENPHFWLGIAYAEADKKVNEILAAKKPKPVTETEKLRAKTERMLKAQSLFNDKNCPFIGGGQ